jgi:NAD(P)-dependent dehydrogenase (short-subunit alcohol dehydrogenase family)
MGADSGSAYMVALKLARHGATIAAQYHANFNESRRLVREIEREGGFAVALKADLADPPQAESLCTRIQGALEGLDIVVINATNPGGAAPRHAIPSTAELADQLQVAAAALLSCLAPAYAALKLMAQRGTGAIVCLDGANPPSGRSRDLTSALVSAAVTATMAHLAAELRSSGVGVLMVATDGSTPVEIAENVCSWLDRWSAGEPAG